MNPRWGSRNTEGAFAMLGIFHLNKKGDKCLSDLFSSRMNPRWGSRNTEGAFSMLGIFHLNKKGDKYCQIYSL